MCGISGVVTVGYNGTTAPDITRLQHRGPDAAGIAKLSLGWGMAHVSMARLSIVDLTPREVPFRYIALPGRALAYNGEVYNWRELREELNDGRGWETECDAEVVARALDRWGPDALRRFNGMFALAFVNSISGHVLLARDRAGEKPLYFARRGERELLFASEPKGLGVPLVEKRCPDLDVFEADCLEETPLRGVRRLGPGELIWMGRAWDVKSPTPKRWWSFPSCEPDDSMTMERAVEELNHVLGAACRDRVPASEVPWALQLSGGIDSALVHSYARAPRVYNVTFPDDGVDNLTDARAVAGEMEVQPVVFGLDDLNLNLPRIAYHLDTPATWTAVCQWFMAQAMHEDGIKVVLTGEGADELFHGYSRYRVLWWADQAATDPTLAAYGALRDRVFDAPQLLGQTLDRSAEGRARQHAVTIAKSYGDGGNLVDQMSRIDWHTTMQILLRMADRMNAAFSIENRAPFFDHRVIELACRMPSRLKIDQNWTKAVLRRLARERLIPHSVAYAPTKKGLFLPWKQWTGEARDWDRSGFAGAMLKAWRRNLSR